MLIKFLNLINWDIYNNIMGETLSNFIESCDECLYRKHKTHLSELENRIYMAEEKNYTSIYK